jgi:hypothetical protein
LEENVYLVHDGKDNEFYVVQVRGQSIPAIEEGAAMKMTLINIEPHESMPCTYAADVVGAERLDNVIGERRFPTCDVTRGYTIVGLMAVTNKQDKVANRPRSVTLSANGQYLWFVFYVLTGKSSGFGVSSFVEATFWQSGSPFEAIVDGPPVVFCTGHMFFSKSSGNSLHLVCDRFTCS